MQSSDTPIRVVAACLGLSAFALAIIAGLSAGSSASQILLRAVVSLVVCVLIGRLVAAVGVYAMDDAARAFRDAHPIERVDGVSGEPADAHSHDGRDASAPMSAAA